MTAPGGDVLAWLDNAITAREQSARDADKELGRTWLAKWDGRTDTFDLVTTSELLVAVRFLPGCSSHASMNDPESVLRRCAADRKLLELHGSRGHGCPAYDYDGDLDEYARFYNHEVCPVVQHLAESYGWTAGQTPPIEGDRLT